MPYITKDDDISVLPLSVRSQNCLRRANIGTIGAMMDYPAEEWIHIRNMGVRSVNEILGFVQALREGTGEYVLVEARPQTETVDAGVRDLPVAELPLSVRARNSLTRGGCTHLTQLLGMTREELMQMPGMGAKSAVEILDYLETIAPPPEAAEDTVERPRPSVVEFAALIGDERIREVIQGRLAGKTLQEIGEQYGVGRERIRQLMQKGLRNRPRLREDRYAYLYEHYDFSLEDFQLAFDEPPETYHYLEMISKIQRGKRGPLEEMLTDTAIAPEYRRKAERAVYKQYVSTDGVRVKMTRPDLVKHYVRHHCRELTGYDVFVRQYHEWLDTLGLGDNPALILESRAYENKLNQCDYVLWNLRHSFRYYAIAERDYEELLTALHLSDYTDVEISSLKLFRDYPDLMKRYDIRDEYELHNLLKKILPAGQENVKFKKMPTIEIGTGDTDEQALSLMLQYAPVTAEDLASRYEEEYGVKALTVRGNLLRTLDPYYYQGVYSVDFAALPMAQMERMKVLLDRDFYTIAEVKGLYRREFPQADESMINPYTLKTLDFRVYSGYVLKNTYPSAADYFRSLLTGADLVNAENISKSVQNVVAYASELYKLRADYEIVEFSPLRYINIRRLNAAGVTTEHFAAYCRDVARRYEKGDYFTVESLRKEGFVHEMDDLGFEDWFYSSVLLEDRERFSYQRVGGTRLFLRGRAGANLGGMLVWLLEKHQKLDFYDLQELLENHYGITLPREKLLTIIAGTELYYDAIMEAVYIDYDTYFEEI